MGEAESEAEVAAAAALAEGGEASDAGKAGSLPPRKRLLVGLKQGSSGSGNGKEESNPGVPLSPSAMMMTEPPNVDGAIGGVKQEQQQEPGACARCGSKDESAWRRLKKTGVYQRLCSSCTLLYSMNMFCPYCLLVYQDASTLGDPSVWLNCCNCRRSVHIECELKSPSPAVAVDPEAYRCPECRPKDKVPVEDANPSSPSHKKQRTGRLTDSDGPKVEAPSSGGGPSKLLPTRSHHEALIAAKNAAAAASKTAANLRAAALAKAQAAAKAAVAARAALDAAAQAARAEVQARAELRRNSVRVDGKGYAIISPKLETGADKGKSHTSEAEELLRREHEAKGSPSVMDAKANVFKLGSDGGGGGDGGLFEQSDLGGGGVSSSGADAHFSSSFLLNSDGGDGNNSFPFTDILAGFPDEGGDAGAVTVTGVGMELDACIPGIGPSVGMGMENDEQVTGVPMQMQQQQQNAVVDEDEACAVVVDHANVNGVGMNEVKEEEEEEEEEVPQVNEVGVKEVKDESKVKEESKEEVKVEQMDVGLEFDVSEVAMGGVESSGGGGGEGEGGDGGGGGGGGGEGEGEGEGVVDERKEEA